MTPIKAVTAASLALLAGLVLWLVATPALAQYASREENIADLRLGQRVRHQKFGDGVVLSVEGQGSNARVQVNFERQGTKWLMMGYANLQVV